MQPGSPAYVFRSHMMPGPQILQYQRPNTNGARTKNVPVMQLPYNSVKLLDYPVSSGITMSSPRQSQIVVQAHPSQFTQRSGSDQMAGWMVGGTGCIMDEFKELARCYLRGWLGIWPWKLAGRQKEVFQSHGHQESEGTTCKIPSSLDNQYVRNEQVPLDCSFRSLYGQSCQDFKSPIDYINWIDCGKMVSAIMFRRINIWFFIYTWVILVCRCTLLFVVRVLHLFFFLVFRFP